MRAFITGTDTGAGKTWFTSLLTRTLAERGDMVRPCKPVCCGERSDAIRLLEASGRSELSLNDVNPEWLKTPAAPWAACLIENRQIDVAEMLRKASEGDADHVLVEGVGGWEVPLTADQTMADFAAELGFPIIVVVDSRLGALNHTILTVRNIEARGLVCAGIVLNQVSEERDAASISNRMVLEEFLGVPVLAELMHDQDWLDLEPFETNSFLDF